MRQLTRKEEIQLGKEINQAKNEVLKRWGFTNEERAKVLRTSANVIDILNAED